MSAASPTSFAPGDYGGAALFEGLTEAQAARLQARLAKRQRAFELNDKQYDFVYEDVSKWVAYIGGIGGGKSYAGAVKALRKASELPGSLGLIGAPTYQMLRDATMRSVFELFPEAMVAKFNKSEGLLALVNGSEILFRSTDDPNRLRGPNLAWFWLDEGPLCGYEAWRIMKGRLRQSGFTPQGWITGSPRGEDHFYEDFEATLQPNHKLFRASTRENAHNLPPGFIEDLGYTGNFALQEIEGLFVSFDGLVYEYRDLYHQGEWDEATKRLTGNCLRVGGVDWGFTNPAVALPIWIDGDSRAYVRDEFYQREAGYAGVEDAIVEFTRKYGIELWYCGPDEPEHIQLLNVRLGKEKLHSRAVEAIDDINPGLDTVRQQLKVRGDGRGGLQLSSRCPQTRAEFRTYAYPEKSLKRASRDPQEKPVKAFDHAMDALRYALHSSVGVTRRHRALDGKQRDREGRRAPVSGIGGVSVYRKQF